MPPQSDYGTIRTETSEDERQPLNPDEKVGGPPLSAKKSLYLGIAILAIFLTFKTTFPKAAVIPNMFKDDKGGYYGWIPDEELGLQAVHRNEDASPSVIWGNKTSGPLPTNSWYLNLVSHRAARPDESTKVYTVPYIIDTAPANDLAGIKVHWPVTQSSDRNVQMVSDFKNGITLGTDSLSNNYTVDQEEDLSPLGITLMWQDDEGSGAYMKSHLVRGMPYATMMFAGGLLPKIFSYNGPASQPVVDGTTVIECGQYNEKNGSISNTTGVAVMEKVQLHFRNSDFTWIAFFSQPVKIECGVSPGDEQLAQFQLNVKEIGGLTDEPLVVRLAILDQCTSGKSNIKQHCEERMNSHQRKEYLDLLEQSVDIFPSSPTIDFEYPKDMDDEEKMAYINIDWKPETVGGSVDAAAKKDLLMFAMPHHQMQMQEESSNITDICISTFHGSTCLVKGSKWSLAEDLSQPQSFTARRPPVASAIGLLAEALSKDIHYRLSDNLHRGAADTYFSGKILARVARTIVIADELKQLAAGINLEDAYPDVEEDYLQASIKAAAAVRLPADTSIDSAVADLKECVQVWLEDAEAAYLYDRSWGGLVNCGCTYTGKGSHGFCNNTYPDCPALTDVNVDFGNGTH
eukprot:scaffold2353_cov134-Cylindrotheca_fusiformis.AAC.1